MTSFIALGYSVPTMDVASAAQRPARVLVHGFAQQSKDMGLSYLTATAQLMRPPVPSGEWEATGRVLRSVNVAGQHKGSVLRRDWAFTTSCRNGKCRTMFKRSTLYGTSVTVLKRHGKTFTAVFPPVAVPCLGPHGVTHNRPGRLHDRYRLWWSKNGQRLIAIQHQVGGGRCGPASQAKFRWTAKLVYPVPGSPEPEA